MMPLSETLAMLEYCKVSPKIVTLQPLVVIKGVTKLHTNAIVSRSL